MVQDKSEDFEKTWNFLDRRMKDLGTVAKLAKSVSSMVVTWSRSLVVEKA